MHWTSVTLAVAVRQFPVDLINVEAVTVIDGGRAALTIGTPTRVGRAVWLADWAGTISQFAQDATALDAWGTDSDAELLIEEVLDGAKRFRRVSVQTGHELARVEVPAPATAVYLSDGSVAVASRSSIGVWTAAGLDLNPSAFDGIGEFQRLSAGQNVLVGSLLVDPRTGKQVGRTMPFSYDAAIEPQGDRIVLLTGAGSYAQYQLEVHDAKTGETLKVGNTATFDLVGPGPAILAWVTDNSIVTRTHGGLGGVEPTTRLTSAEALTEGMDITSLIPVESEVYANGGSMLVYGHGFLRLIQWVDAP